MGAAAIFGAGSCAGTGIGALAGLAAVFSAGAAGCGGTTGAGFMPPSAVQVDRLRPNCACAVSVMAREMV